MSAAMRFADSADVEAITNLINLAFRVEKFFVDSDRINSLEVCGRTETGRFILAGAGDTPHGCVYVELRGNRAYIGLLSVDPARQGVGLGSRLMAEAERFARQNGCCFADLSVVNLRQELPAFYRRLGYVEMGTAPFPADVVTKLACHFVTMTKVL